MSHGTKILDISLLPMYPDCAGISAQEEGIMAKAATDKIPEKYYVLIECASEAEQVELLKKLIEEGVKCRALIS